MSRAERITGSPLSAPELARQVRPVSLAGERTLPLIPVLAPLFPSGRLRRGSTVLVSALPSGTSTPQGATSLALAIGAAASAEGSWCGAVSLPDLGLLAAAELGASLERLVLVPHVPPAQWAAVVGALIDAVDILVVRPPAHLRLGDARRLSTRARERQTVLVPLVASAQQGWAEGTDVRLRVTAGTWEGPGTGHGHLTSRRMEVAVEGRGAAARPHHVELCLPAPMVPPELASPHRAEPTSEAYAGADAHLLPRHHEAGLRSVG